MDDCYAIQGLDDGRLRVLADGTDPLGAVRRARQHARETDQQVALLLHEGGHWVEWATFDPPELDLHAARSPDEGG